jgi:hypothetical protein
MKKILLAVIFVTAFSIIRVTAQVFIPQPPVINIPLLDPSRMIIQNEVSRNTINAAEAARRGGANGTKTNRTAAAIDYTVFNSRPENSVSKLLAQTGKGNAAEQRQAEQFYNSQIENYEQAATYNHQLPANDVAYALVYFILVHYQVYYDLYDVPGEKDPWAKRAKDGFERLALLNTKKSRTTTEDEDRAMYYQLKKMLSAKPEFRKMTDKQKQEMTETLAVVSGVVKTGYLKAIEDEDEKLIEQAHETAKQGLEKLLGVPIDKIKFNLSGLQLQ